MGILTFKKLDIRVLRNRAPIPKGDIMLLHLSTCDPSLCPCPSTDTAARGNLLRCSISAALGFYVDLIADCEAPTLAKSGPHLWPTWEQRVCCNLQGHESSYLSWKFLGSCSQVSLLHALFQSQFLCHWVNKHDNFIRIWKLELRGSFLNLTWREP